MYATAIHLVRRPKLSGLPGWHFGVACQSGVDGVVYDLTQEHGVRVRSVTDFLEGIPGQVVQTVVDPCEVSAACRRLRQLLTRHDIHQYHFADRNCEHLARYVVTGKRKSLQVQGAVLVTAMLAVALLLGRKAA